MGEGEAKGEGCGWVRERPKGRAVPVRVFHPCHTIPSPSGIIATSPAGTAMTFSKLKPWARKTAPEGKRCFWPS